MSENLHRALERFHAPPPREEFDARMRRLLSEPPAAVVEARVVRWPVAIMALAVVGLVWAWWPITPVPEGTVLKHEVTVTSAMDRGGVAADGVNSDRVQLVTTIRLEGYVPVRDARLVVDRRAQ